MLCQIVDNNGMVVAEAIDYTTAKRIASAIEAKAIKIDGNVIWHTGTPQYAIVDNGGNTIGLCYSMESAFNAAKQFAYRIGQSVSIEHCGYVVGGASPPREVMNG